MINAGIVGIGRWGQTLVQAVAGKSELIRFTRGVTRTPSKVKEFARAHDLPLSDDYAALLADPQIDAVVLATPHSQHLDQILQAAAAGKHIFVEKPLTLDAVSALRAYRAAREAGVVLALGHNRRCLPAYIELRQIIADGLLGKLLHCEGNFSGPSAYRQSRDGWRADTSESPAGGMTGKGIHITDIMISIFGPAVSLTAHCARQVLDYGMDDTTTLMLRFADGQTGSLTTLTATPDDWRVQVFGSAGWAEIRDESHLTINLLDSGTRRLDFPKVDTAKEVLDRFAASLQTGATWIVTPRQAIANTALLEAVVQSCAQHARVSIELPDGVGEFE